MSATEQRRSRGRSRGAVTPREIERVMDFEAERRAAGYSPGWTYHRAREQRLILAYEHTLGAYVDTSEQEYAPQRGRPLRQNEPLLSVEMVPDSCPVKSVRQSVDAGRWRAVSAPISERSGHRCEVCLGKGRRYAVGCHGVFDYDQRAGIQRLTGFVALCPGCAEGRYIHLAEARGRYEAAYKRLLMINRWTEVEADQHIARAHAVCERRLERRSGTVWVQDLSLIEAMTTNQCPSAGYEVRRG